MKFDVKKRIPLLFLIAGFSFAAGIVGGLFGTGGGILIVLLFLAIYADSEKYTKRDCFAMTLCCTVILSAVSFFSYTQKGGISLQNVLPIILPSALGGIAGALLLDKIPLTLLRKIFAALIIYAGISMLF